jgi:hypothetical protein
MIRLSLCVIALLMSASASSFALAAAKPLVRPIRTDAQHVAEYLELPADTLYQLGPSICVNTWMVAELKEVPAVEVIFTMAAEGFVPAPEPSGGRPGRSALLALRLSDGRASQLVPPPSGSPDEVNTISHHYPAGPNRCITVLSTYQRSKADQWSLVDSSAWEWSLDTNALRAVGRWTFADMLTPILDRNLAAVQPVSAQADGRITVNLAQKNTNRRASLLLQSPGYLDCATFFYRAGETIIPQRDRRSVALFRVTPAAEDEPLEFSLDCIDPGAASGSRWSLHPKDISRWTGVSPTSVEPVKGLDGKGGIVALAVQGLDPSRKARDFLLFVDEATGTLKSKTAVAVKKTSDDYVQPYLSDDGTKAVYLSFEVVVDQKDQAKSEDRHTLTMIDTRTSRTLLRADVSACCYDNTIVKFEPENARVLTYTRSEVKWLSARRADDCQRVFMLHLKNRG